MLLSTSSSSAGHLFSPSPEEHASIKRWPAGALFFLALVVVVECFWRLMLPWYADLAAWQWHVKQELMADHTLNGDLAIIGSSVLFHAMDAKRVNTHLATALSGQRRPPTVVNLALNGMFLQHQTQLLDRFIRRGHLPQEIILELRAVEIKQDSWIVGPYWQFWATPAEFVQSGALWLEPKLLVSFVSNRVWWSFPYYQSLERWLLTFRRLNNEVQQVYQRNRAVQREMREHLGFTPGTFIEGLTPAAVTPDMRHKSQAWTVTAAGEYWLHQFLTRAAAQGMRVNLLQPPAPPFVVERRQHDGFDGHFQSYVAQLRQRYPTLGLQVFAPQGYVLDDFADTHHLSVKGAQRLSDAFARWVAQR